MSLNSHLNNRPLFLLLHSFLSITWLFSFSCSAYSQGYQSHESIRETAESAVREFVHLSQAQSLELRIGNIDPRLKFNHCLQTLQGFLPTGARPDTLSLIGVRCASKEKPWKLYLPVSMRILTPVVTTSRPIPRNTVIQAEDVKISMLPKKQLRMGYYIEVSQIIGKKSTRYLASGQVINPQLLTEKSVVQRGQTVIILAKNNHLRVKAKGVAMATGRIGDFIKVRNRASERIVDAVVVAPGKVEVTL